MSIFGFRPKVSRYVVTFVFCLTGTASGFSQRAVLPDIPDVYTRLKAFQLDGGSHTVDNLVMSRDRVELTFTGTFYFESPTEGEVRGAVFVGDGYFRSETPQEPFERDNIERLLGAANVESDFSTAVLRFTDDTFDRIGPADGDALVPEDVQELADEFEARFLEETGTNVSSRLAVSILNGEAPGFFVGEFDGGDLDRFALVLDRQSRIPAAGGVNAGEKGFIFAYRSRRIGVELWTAFYSAEDYERGISDYSDAFDLVETPHYAMEIDLRERSDTLRLKTEIDFIAAVDDLRAIPMSINLSLPEIDNIRRDKSMLITTARLSDGTPIEAVQEEWERGLTLFLPTAANAGDSFSVVLEFEGENLTDTLNCYYPLSNSDWYPRHGYLTRSTFDLVFLHHEDDSVATGGVFVDEQVAEEDDDERVSRFRIEDPVSLVTFAVGRFNAYRDESLVEDLPIDFLSIRGQVIKEDFIMAEMGNAINYFTDLFGAYPYPRFGGVHHPFPFGQGFASLLLIPAVDRSNNETFAFIAHETAHQWWGNIVAWRSYRDQWLSEGFAEYSGVLYTGARDNPSGAMELIDAMRYALINNPRTTTGIGPGRLADIGPLTMGIRLNTPSTLGAYQRLIYAKGALVLRMLHFLLSDPDTGEDQTFFDMMTDFVERHRGQSATTDSFHEIANEYFARSPIAATIGVDHLNWFFQQWVYEAHLPEYRMEYALEAEEDGAVVVRGTIFQEDVGEQFFMPLPVRIRFDGDIVGRVVLYANGPESPFAVRLPQRPREIELDPEKWILSSDTETDRR